jgi:aryl-alcohol dehydrogenase-like predicted oxidoreductase
MHADGGPGQRRPQALAGVQLGLGLTQLGRKWGYRASDVPSAADAQRLLRIAMRSGIRVFDTAPSYGPSEERLGSFLGGLSAAERRTLFIATKCGESWDEGSNEPVVDHRFDVLAASIDRSLSRLGTIDLLQLHRATASVLRTRDVRRVIDHAQSLGIEDVGASVSDMESARIALGELGVSVIQFPFHRGSAHMEPAFELAAAHGCGILVNRSLGMGRLPYGGANSLTVNPAEIVEAYRFVLSARFDGAILTGTSSAEHLATNIGCYAEASR